MVIVGQRLRVSDTKKSVLNTFGICDRVSGCHYSATDPMLLLTNFTPRSLPTPPNPPEPTCPILFFASSRVCRFIALALPGSHFPHRPIAMSYVSPMSSAACPNPTRVAVPLFQGTEDPNDAEGNVASALELVGGTRHTRTYCSGVRLAGPCIQ